MSEQAYAVVGYIRVSTSEQADSGAGLEAQRAAITSEAERRGWELLHVFEDAGASGKSMNGRAGLQEALEAVEEGRAQALVVAKLDRLSRSAPRLRCAHGAGAQARLEPDRPRPGRRYLDSGRGDDGLGPRDLRAVRAPADRSENEGRARGEESATASTLGRPREISPATVERMRELYERGLSAAAIARRLNEEGIETPRGGRWHHGGVVRALSWVRA